MVGQIRHGALSFAVLRAQARFKTLFLFTYFNHGILFFTA